MKEKRLQGATNKNRKRTLEKAGEKVRIIEDYPDDKFSLCCLLFGFTKAGRPLHLQVSYFDSVFVKIITIYEPDPDKWENFSKRR